MSQLLKRVLTPPCAIKVAAFTNSLIGPKRSNARCCFTLPKKMATFPRKQWMRFERLCKAVTMCALWFTPMLLMALIAGAGPRGIRSPQRVRAVKA